MEKEFLYVGHYTDTDGNYILKVGITNDLKRRRTEHTRNYRRAKQYTMPPTANFEYDWSIPLSKYNTIRFEDKNREKLKSENIGTFVRNDRFCYAENPGKIEIKIRKVYEIILSQGLTNSTPCGIINTQKGSGTNESLCYS